MEKVNKTLSTALSLSDMESQMKVLDTVEELLQDERALTTMVETCAQGGSIDSVEMMLGISPGMLERWLRNGQHDKDGPFRALYLFYTRASANARLMAEAALLSKNPDKWLEKVEVRSKLRESSNGSEPLTFPGTATQNDPDPSDQGLDFLEVDDPDPA